MFILVEIAKPEKYRNYHQFSLLLLDEPEGIFPDVSHSAVEHDPPTKCLAIA